MRLVKGHQFRAESVGVFFLLVGKALMAVHESQAAFFGVALFQRPHTKIRHADFFGGLPYRQVALGAKRNPSFFPLLLRLILCHSRLYPKFLSEGAPKKL